MKKNSGNMMAVFLGILLLVTIFFPLVVHLVQNESKQAVNHQKSTVAFQLAEAAVAKGVAKLTENRLNWTNAAAGTPLPGYNDDHEYTDVAGGRYKIAFASGSAPGIVLIIGKGLDASSREVRAIEAEYSGVDPDGAALLFSQGQAASGADAHWGSVKSWGNLKHFNQYGWPRLFASGSISNRDIDSAPPNTNNTEYWAFRPDMGSPPQPDLAYYKQKAMNSIVPSSSTTGEIRHPDGTPVLRLPVNSGYFSSAVGLQQGEDMHFDKLSTLPEAMGNLYEFRSSTSVLYFDLNMLDSSYPRFFRTFLDVEAVIISGCCSDVVNSSVPYMVYGATIPETAPIHYQGKTVWHTGFPSGEQYWASNFNAVYTQPSRCCYDITNLQIHGYAYINTSLSRAKFLGVVQQSSPSASWSTNSQVYYDPSVLNNIVWAQAPLYRRSWKESSRSW